MVRQDNSCASLFKRLKNLATAELKSKDNMIDSLTAKVTELYRIMSDERREARVTEDKRAHLADVVTALKVKLYDLQNA